MDPSTKLDQLLVWIDLDVADRPQLITGYVSTVVCGAQVILTVHRFLKLIKRAIISGYADLFSPS